MPRPSVVAFAAIALAVSASFGCGRLGFVEGPADAAVDGDAASSAEAGMGDLGVDLGDGGGLVPDDATMDAPADADLDAPDDAMTDAPDDAALDAPDDAPADAPPADAPPADAPPADAPPTVRLTLRITGEGMGDIASSGSPLACGRLCSLDVPAGTTVRLVATPDAASWFRGWSMGPCSGRATCEATLAADTEIQADFTLRPNRIFVTSSTYAGDFGGLAGADAICQGHADAASLAGTWVALLSTTTTSWTSRVTGYGGWIRVDGVPVFNREVTATNTYLGAPGLDENGAAQFANTVWMPGSTSSPTCDEYTSAAPSSTHRVDNAWRASSFSSGGAEVGCDERHRLICAETSTYQVLSPVQAVGRGAFTSNGTWSLSAGRAAADTLCQTEAASASRGGTYLALLALSGQRPLDRFDLDGPTWVRADGQAFLPTARDWLTATYFDVAPLLTANGATLGSHTVFMGASGPGAVAGASTSTCSDWTSSTGMTMDTVCARSWDVRSNCGASAADTFCSSTSFRVLCLEQ